MYGVMEALVLTRDLLPSRRRSSPRRRKRRARRLKLAGRQKTLTTEEGGKKEERLPLKRALKPNKRYLSPARLIVLLPLVVRISFELHSYQQYSEMSQWTHF
jgi:hypothetical protein